jgi:hypothetical protein
MRPASSGSSSVVAECSDEEDWNYAEKLHAILMKDAPFYHLARMVCIRQVAIGDSREIKWITSQTRPAATVEITG